MFVYSSLYIPGSNTTSPSYNVILTSNGNLFRKGLICLCTALCISQVATTTSKPVLIKHLRTKRSVFFYFENINLSILLRACFQQLLSISYYFSKVNLTFKNKNLMNLLILKGPFIIQCTMYIIKRNLMILYTYLSKFIHQSSARIFFVIFQALYFYINALMLYW